MPGTRTSDVEVVQLTPFGLWLAWEDTEFFLDHDLFPWFRNASVGKVFDVELAGEAHFYWPQLDVDLDVDRIRHPERYPLVARQDD